MFKTATLICIVCAIALFSSAVKARNCEQECNDKRLDVLTLEICRNAKKQLPRPKIGDWCSRAMEQGYSDACISLCNGENPKNRVAEACRSASMEMPRPTVRRWCEHGYQEAFSKANAHLRPIFADRKLQAEPPKEEVSPPEEEEHEPEPDTEPEESTVAATIPVTLEDGSTHNLVVMKGQNAEEAVVAFCRANVPDEVSSCIRQLLTVVLEKLDEQS